MATFEEITTKTRLLLLDLLGTFENGKLAFWAEFTTAPRGKSGLQVIFEPHPITRIAIPEHQAIPRYMEFPFSLTQRELTLQGMQQMQTAIDRLYSAFPTIEIRSVPPKDGFLPRTNCSILTWQSVPLSVGFLV